MPKGGSPHFPIKTGWGYYFHWVYLRLIREIKLTNLEKGKRVKSKKILRESSYVILVYRYFLSIIWTLSTTTVTPRRSLKTT